MNKKIRFSLLTLLTMLCNMAFADAYTVDFNTAIATSSHDFAVASKWKHIVQDNDGSYVGYKWDAAYGTGDPATGGLLVYKQKVGSSYYYEETVYDMLVTPKVSGTIKLKVKAYENASSSTKAFVQLWSVNGSGTEKNTQLKEFQTEIPGYNTGSGEWIELTYDVTEVQRIGIRAQYVYIDDFYAEAIDTTPEAALTVSSVMNMEGKTGTNGTTTYYDEQADGTLSVPLKVLLSNTGDVDFVAGTTANYTLTLGSASSASGTKTYYDEASVNVPVSLASGTSDTVDVTFTIPFTTGWKYFFVKENISGTTSSSYRYAGVNAYEPKFIFRAAESTSTSSLSAAQAFGLISEATTKNFEIANTGTAPLTIKSITLPEGFTSANMPEIPTEGLIIAKGAKQALDITLPATAQGSFSGNLTIKYLDKSGTEQTYTLAFSGNVLPAGTWAADFSGENNIAYPAGSIAEGGINSDYAYADGAYNYFIKGRTSSSYATGSNMFITPKLHATAGQQLTFDVKGVYGTSYYAKVYVSTDRKTWGDPIATYTYGETEGAVAIGSSDWVNKSVTFDAEGDYYVAFALYGEFKIDNIIGLTKVDVAHDLYIKSVSWPDASIKSGTALAKPSVEIIPLTDEVAENYTVKYIYGENVVNIDSKNLTASASSSTTFSASFTPTVETTTAFPGTKIVFEFTDGTKYETEGFDLTVTNEAIFHFLDSKPTSKWYEPTDRTAPITFGKINEAKELSFVLFNWGSAPLTVNSISLPEGFSTTTEFPLTVAAFNGENNGIDAACQTLNITFSATTADTYSGDMVITYSGDKTFTLPISGTMLDATKFYANFNDQNWPVGSIYQDNVSITYFNTGDYGLQSSSATKNLFITPKLTATEGDKLQFDASTRNSTYNGTVKVYISTDREIWGEPVEEMALSKTENTSKATYEYKFASAGDYYVAFELNEARVDDIYGLKLAEVAHEWTIASSNIPSEAMQNVASTATINLLNLGLANEAADSYTVTAYVNDKVAGTGSAVAIPMNHNLSDAGTQLSVNFLYPKVGTYEVYLEVKAGDYRVVTAPVDVTFTEEVAVAKAIAIGTKSGKGRDYGFVDWYNNDGSQTRYTDILYTAEKIADSGIKAGDKITSIAFRSVSNSEKSFKAEVTSWVGLSTGDITYGNPVKADMEEIQVYADKINFPANFESVITLTTPIVWDGNSDIRVYTEAIGQGSGNWISADYDYDSNINMSYNGTKKAAPLLYVTLAAESATLSGTVKTSSNAAIAGATVTLKAANGVEYTGTTDAEGAYSINVIQAGLDFTVTVEAENYEDQQFAYSLGGSSKTLDIKFYPELTLNNSEDEVNSYKGKADVTVARTLKAGWNAVVLPFALTADDITNAFGADAEVATYDGDEQNGDNVHINFTKATTVAAGVPFLLYLKTAPASAPVFTDKAVNFTVNNAEGNVFDFVGTFANTTAATGDYILSGGKFKNAAGGNAINAYRAYLKLKGAAASRVSLYIDGFLVENETTAITGAKMNGQQENVYSLSGQKMNNQLKKGIYIINGKKVVIK
jgi:hypothetical protein